MGLVSGRYIRPVGLQWMQTEPMGPKRLQGGAKLLQAGRAHRLRMDRLPESARTSAPADLATWWTVFHDPALNGLVQAAACQNINLRVAGMRDSGSASLARHRRRRAIPPNRKRSVVVTPARESVKTLPTSLLLLSAGSASGIKASIWGGNLTFGEVPPGGGKPRTRDWMLRSRITATFWFCFWPTWRRVM